MRVGMQWDGYQQRWMHQMHGSLDITQDQGEHEVSLFRVNVCANLERAVLIRCES